MICFKPFACLLIASIFIISCGKKSIDPTPETQTTPPVDVPVVVPPVTAPTLTSFAPARGLPNSAITINGTNFSVDVSKNTVTIGGVAGIVHTATATQLIVTVPSTVKTGKIVVISDKNTVASTSDFTVITGTQSEFGRPGFRGITVDGLGNVFGDNFSSVYKISAASNGTATLFAGDASNPNKPFHDVAGLAADVGGNIYVADEGGHKIFKINPAGIATILAGNETSGYTDGQGTAATFKSPNAITVDASGNVFVADIGVIRKISPTGLVTTFIGDHNKYSSIDGQGTSASVTTISGLAADSKGNIYVTEASIVRKITPDGTIKTIAGSYKQDFVNGLGTAAQFYVPGAIAVDAAGNLFVCDNLGGNRSEIRMINTAGYVSTFLESSGRIVTLTNGSLDIANTDFPQGLAFDTTGNLFVSNVGSFLNPPIVSKIVFK